jgi:uncharacterized membrane protein YbhN (UPF0104 family)
MALFWAGEIFAVWSGLAAFGFRMDPAALTVGFATGMLFTRRTGPLGGAGLLVVVLSLTIRGSGAPFAVAIAGVFVYQVLSLWLPTVAALAGLPTLRALAGTGPGPRRERPARRMSPGRQSLPVSPPPGWAGARACIDWR